MCREAVSFTQLCACVRSVCRDCSRRDTPRLAYSRGWETTQSIVWGKEEGEIKFKKEEKKVRREVEEKDVALSCHMPLFYHCLSGYLNRPPRCSFRFCCTIKKESSCSLEVFRLCVISWFGKGCCLIQRDLSMGQSP